MTTPKPKLEPVGGRNRLLGSRGGQRPDPKLQEALAGLGDQKPGSGGVAAALAEIHSRAAESGLAIVKMSPAALAPHPMNSAQRSLPHPGAPKWVELVEQIKALGVQVPLLAVTRETFVEARPDLADQIPVTATHVVIYGHRRRAGALEAEVESIPVIVDDRMMIDDADLDAMHAENSSREELDRIELAQHLAFYYTSARDGAKVSTRSLAERLGYKQPTVSRLLALLLLTPEIQDDVRTESLGFVDAVAVAGKLPWGPRRPWQTEVDAEQDTDARRLAQTAAVELIRQGMTATAALARVNAEQSSRTTAEKLGIEIVDDARARFGEAIDSHRVASVDAAHGEDVVAAIDSRTGGLEFFAVVPPAAADTPATDTADSEPAQSRPEKDNDSGPRALAQRSRRRAVAAAACKGASRDRLGGWLITLARWRVRSDHSRAWALAHSWLRSAGLCEGSVDDWMTGVESEADQKSLQRSLWAVSLAAAELRASDRSRAWDGFDSAYLAMLTEAGGYTPADWEVQQLRQLTEAAA